MLFKAEWYDLSTGQVRTERREGATSEAVGQQLQRAGHIVLAIRPVWMMPRRREKLDMGAWCLELQTLLGAGMTVVEALETQLLQTRPGEQRRVLDTLLTQLQQGKALSSAMREAAAFPPVLIAGVTASERSGALPSALEEFARYHELLLRLRRQIVAAAIYPTLVLTVGLIIVAFLLLVVLPRFSQMYAGVQGAGGTVTQLLIGLSVYLNAHQLMFSLGLACLVGLAATAWQHPGTRHGLLQRALQLPGLRQPVEQLHLAKLYQSLALLYRGGYAVPQALELCAGLSLGASIDAQIQQAHAALVRGERMSAAMAEQGLADETCRRLLAAGERNGQIARVLQDLADRHARGFSQFVDRATRLVEPMLLLMVAMAVGGIVLAMYMPVFDMASQMR